MKTFCTTNFNHVIFGIFGGVYFYSYTYICWLLIYNHEVSKFIFQTMIFYSSVQRVESFTVHPIMSCQIGGDIVSFTFPSIFVLFYHLILCAYFLIPHSKFPISDWKSSFLIKSLELLIINFLPFHIQNHQTLWLFKLPVPHPNI